MQKAIILTAMAIATFAGSAFADVKIKSRQTMSGQTSENTTLIKGKRSRTEMMDGLLVSITQCDLARDLQLNPQTKTYMVNSYSDGTVGEPRQVDTKSSVPATKGGTMYVTTTIKDTGERKQMFGYTARHIVQTVVMESSADACVPTNTKMEMDMWVIDDQFDLSCLQNRQYTSRPSTKSGCTDKIVPKTIGAGKSGYALWQKMTSFDANGKESFSMIQEVVELSKATLDQALFEVPADYREVSDSAQMYATSVASQGSYGSSSSSPSNLDPYGAATSSPLSASVKTAAAIQPETPPTSLSAKKAGTVRIGVAVKTTSVGEGITANDLSAAVQNTLGQYLKGTKVEVVPLEAKLVAAQAGEAKEKECDFVLNVTAAHKKGSGGGFGFGKILGQAVAQSGMLGATGSVAGNIAGNVASQAITSATSLSGNVKSKDELTLDLRLQSIADNSTPLSRQLKTKAKADGDDIISALIEQAAEAIINAVGK